jgi:alkaline phosphatase/alkaline phosphatase D
MLATIPATRKLLAALALLVAIGSAPGCGSARPEATPDIPNDNRDRIAVDLPQTGSTGSPTSYWQGEMAGEVGQHSVILRARLAVKERAIFGDVKGRSGVAVFVLSTDEDFQDAFRTRWMRASAENDYVVKTKVADLEAGTRYYYRLLSGPEVDLVQAGPVGTFRTLEARGVAREVSLVAVTSMHRYSFRATALRDLAFRQRALGFPSLEAIVARDPDFFVGTGDNVYYDCPYLGRAKTRRTMRAKWHKQFATPRFKALFRHVPTYWMKDDHDYRYDDADPYGSIEPLPELGAEVFLEQVPVVDPEAQDPLTYRTHRLNDLVQIWLLEARDYRDPNEKPPGLDKTMWGEEQKAWLKQTLLSSDATFKVILSPTPMVGPDDAWTGVQGGLVAPLFGGNPLGQGGDKRKRDNHTNPYGFDAEAEAFFDWLLEQSLENVYFVCGDRHWQYHSIHPDGFEEFSVGALVDGSSRLGPRPGEEGSTDPEGVISQPYQQDEPGGGFLELTVYPPTERTRARATFTFYDKHGAPLYRVQRMAR